MDDESYFAVQWGFNPTPEQWRKLHADPRCGPVYPGLSATVEKWRRLNWKRDLTADETREYGRAVLKAIHALNKPPGRVEVDTRCTGWKPDPAVKRLAALADAAIEKRIGSKAFKAWRESLLRIANSGGSL
jgi:hypothetical protein